MTYITKPVIDDSDVLNLVARDLLIEDHGKPKLKKRFNVLTSDGVSHELSFNQLDALINILDSSRSVPKITPLQYLVNHYDIKDIHALGKAGWLVSEYLVVMLADSKVARFEGVLSKAGEVNKIFTFALGSFDFIQQLSLSRCIAALHKDFEDVLGTYDISYVYRFDAGGHSISTDVRGFDEKQSDTSA